MIKESWSLNDQIFGPAIHCTSVLAASAARSGRQTGDISVRPWTAIRPNGTVNLAGLAALARTDRGE
jgi:hypothetical protein